MPAVRRASGPRKSNGLDLHQTLEVLDREIVVASALYSKTQVQRTRIISQDIRED